MEGIYSKTLRQAFRLTKGFKILRLAGLFLVWPLLIRSFLLMAVIGAYTQQVREPAMNTFSQTEGDPWMGLVLALVILFLALQYSKYKAAVTVAVNQLRTQSAISRTEVMRQARPYAMPLLKVAFTIFILTAITAAVLTAPVAHLAASDYETRAMTLGLMASAIFFALLFFLLMGAILIPLYQVGFVMTPPNSLRASYDLLRKRLPVLASFSVIMVAIELMAFALAFAVAAVVTYAVVLLVTIFYDMGGSATWVQALAGTAGFVVFFISQVYLASFQKVAWAVMFFEIVRPQKSAEAVLAAETVPEELAT